MFLWGPMRSAGTFPTQSGPLLMHGIGFRLIPSSVVVIARTPVLLLTCSCSECEPSQSSA